MIISANCCCGLIELGDFDDHFSTKEHILSQIKSWLSEELRFESEIPRTFFATTNTEGKYQLSAAIALKELGFLPKKFHSRHDKGNKKSLTFWMLTDYPKELKPWIRQEKARIRKENRDNGFY